MTEKQKIIKEI